MKSIKKTVDKVIEDAGGEVKKQQDMRITFKTGEVVMFEDFAGHQIGNTWVAIFTKDNQTVLFPVTSIEAIVVTTKE